MLRFTALEDLGLCIAAISERSDGDCVHLEAQRRVCQAAGASFDRIVLLNQVHGDRVISAEAVQRDGPDPREGDGQWR